MKDLSDTLPIERAAMDAQPSFARPAPSPVAQGDGASLRPDHRAALERLCAFYSTLSPDSLQDIAGIYAREASFKDPFNEVVGVPAIEAIFRAMFDQLDAPRFLIRATVLEGARACVTWDFEFGFRSLRRGQTQVIRGASWLEFDEAGQVSRHRDYWDAAEELYEKLPVIGVLMRAMRRKLAH
jgi:hypothetical protein